MAKEPEANKEKEAPAEETAEKPAAEAPKPNAPARTGILLVIIFGFLIMVSTPLITFFLVRSTVGSAAKPELPEKPPDKKAPPAPRPTAETVVDVEPVVVNIDGTQGTRYLKLSVQLVVSDAKLAADLKDASRRAMVKDRIIASAGNKTIADLDGERGRETLRREIIQRLNSEFGDKMNGSILDVYYSEYLIQ